MSLPFKQYWFERMHVYPLSQMCAFSVGCSCYYTEFCVDSVQTLINLCNVICKQLSLFSRWYSSYGYACSKSRILKFTWHTWRSWNSLKQKIMTTTLNINSAALLNGLSKAITSVYSSHYIRFFVANGQCPLPSVSITIRCRQISISNDKHWVYEIANVKLTLKQLLSCLRFTCTATAATCRLRRRA